MKKRDWYSPHTVTKFTKPMVKWVIPRLSMLRDGSYPVNPKETGYSEVGGRPDYKPGAKFEIAAGIAAELDIRLQKAGVDGLLLEFLYSLEPNDELFIIEHIAQCLHVERKEVSQRIHNALHFVSGPDGKAGSYKEYIHQNYYNLRLK